MQRYISSVKLVVLHRTSKCLPILQYGLEAFVLIKSELQSLDFTVDRFYMKLFKTSSIAILTECQQMFNCKLPSTLLPERAHSLERTILIVFYERVLWRQCNL